MFAEIDREFLRADRPCPLATVVCTIGRSDMQLPQHRPQGCVSHHLIWVEKGEGIFRTEGESRILGPGEGLFCRRDVPHSYERTGQDFATRWFTFLGCEGLLDYFGVGSYFYFEATDELAAGLDELDRLCRGASTIVSRSAAGYSLVSQWLSGLFGASEGPAARIRQYLEANFARQITLDDVAEHVGMDRFGLCRFYRQTQGVTVMEQLRRIRIAKAKQYLRYASCSVEETGALCGYPSPSYFGKLFRQETGLTPREYREKHSG